MPTFWVTERKNLPESGEEGSWQERVENLPNLEVLVHQGNRMKVKIDDEIPLRMTCSDTCNIDKAS